MELCELTGYGVFDTKLAFPGKKRTQGRVVVDYEVEFYTSVTGKSVVNGEVYDISPGTLLVSRPGDVRGSIFDFRCCYMHMRFASDSPYRELLDSLPTLFRIIDREAYGRLFEELTHHLLGVGYIKDSDFINAKLLELFYYLRKDARRNRNYMEHAHATRQADVSIPHAVEFIRENYRRDLDLCTIAATAGYSPNYFHHLFTAVMGKTPGQYLLQVRVRQARYLLAETDMTLSGIAYECGFSSQSYFTEQFKKLTFFTPGQYRKRCREGYLM